MARGLPDDSDVVKQGAVFSLSDMAELAARLGSIVTYDRYGDVVFLDDFEHGLGGYTLTLSSADGEIALDNTTRRSGTLSVGMNSGTGATPVVYMVRTLPAPVLGKIGVQTAFTLHANTSYLQFSVYWRDGTTSHQFGVRYTHTTGVLSYLDVTRVWIDLVTPGVLWVDSGLFHMLKLVVNLQTMQYERLDVDQGAYSMTGLEPTSDPDTGRPRLRMEIRYAGDGAVAAISYLDDLIVTQNEF